MLAGRMSFAPRVSDIERQRASEQLQAACVEGYLTLDEFSLRVERALAAQTRAELSAVLADLPLGSMPRAPLARSSSTSVVFGAVERSGAWRLPEHSTMLVVLGSCKLDLRRSTISAKVTTIVARVVLGSLEVVVPSGVEIEVDAGAFAASRTLRLGGPPPRPDAPRIVIRAVVFGGSLTVRDEVHAIYELA